MPARTNVLSVAGMALYLLGVVAFLIFSFSSWYVSPYQDENAWVGAFGVAAGIAVVVGAGSLLASTFASGYASKLWTAVLSLVVAVVAAGCVALYISENADDIVLEHKILPSGMTQTPYYALASCVFMAVAGILSLVGAARRKR